jgi:threonine dehydrogenase-like Zn-dependent dehydrogenase
MRAAWLNSAGRLSFRDDLPEPLPTSGEALVEVVLAGVCATDLALAEGYMGFEGIPGHEFVGRALTGPLAGRRVVGEINAGCGTCPVCRGETGLDARHCPHRSVLGIMGRHGAFAERLVLPIANLIEVPDAVTDEQAVFVEPLAAALQILEQLQPHPGMRVLVAGDGRLGLLIAKVLTSAGCSVELAGHHPERVPPGVGDRTGLLDAPSAPTLGERYELAVEATGNPAVLARLFPWVRPRGAIVLKTTAASPATLDLTALVIDELRLVGSRCGRFEPALTALAEGRVEVDSSIHGSYPLADVVTALEVAARPGVLKILIQCSKQ